MKAPTLNDLPWSLKGYPESVRSQILSIITLTADPTQFGTGITRTKLLDAQIDYILGGKVADLTYHAMKEMASRKDKFEEPIPDIRVHLQKMKTEDREAFRTRFIHNAVRPALIQYALRHLSPPATEEELAPLREKEKNFWDHLPYYLPGIKNVQSLQTAMWSVMQDVMPRAEQVAEHLTLLKESAEFASHDLNPSEQAARDSIHQAIRQTFLTHPAFESANAVPDLLAYGFTDASRKVVADILTRHRNIKAAYEKDCLTAENEKDFLTALLEQTLYPYAERRMRLQAADWFPEHPEIKERFLTNMSAREEIRDGVKNELDIQLGNDATHYAIADQLLDDIDRSITKVMPPKSVAKDIIAGCTTLQAPQRSIA